MKKSIALLGFLSLLVVSQFSFAFVNESDPSFCKAFETETSSLCYEAAGNFLGFFYCRGSMEDMYMKVRSFGGGNLEVGCNKSASKLGEIRHSSAGEVAQLASQCVTKWGCYWRQPVAGDTSCATIGKASCAPLS